MHALHLRRRVIESPDDEDRAFWLKRVDDETIYEMALGLDLPLPEEQGRRSETVAPAPAAVYGQGPFSM